MSHSRKVHYFLHGAFAKHGETCLAACHHVLMVTEDTEGVAGKGTGRHVEHTRKQFTCNLVHVGDHEEQTLRCGESGGEGTSLKRAMESACCAAFTLHFLHFHSVAEEVLASLGSPFVHMLRHR